MSNTREMTSECYPPTTFELPLVRRKYEKKWLIPEDVCRICVDLHDLPNCTDSVMSILGDLGVQYEYFHCEFVEGFLTSEQKTQMASLGDIDSGPGGISTNEVRSVAKFGGFFVANDGDVLDATLREFNVVEWYIVARDEMPASALQLDFENLHNRKLSMEQFLLESYSTKNLVVFYSPGHRHLELYTAKTEEVEKLFRRATRVRNAK